MMQQRDSSDGAYRSSFLLQWSQMGLYACCPPILLPLILVMRCAGQTPITAQYENLPGAALYENGYLFS
jgi:hypothetical protein